MTKQETEILIKHQELDALKKEDRKLKSEQRKLKIKKFSKKQTAYIKILDNTTKLLLAIMPVIMLASATTLSVSVPVQNEVLNEVRNSSEYKITMTQEMDKQTEIKIKLVELDQEYLAGKIDIDEYVKKKNALEKNILSKDEIEKEYILKSPYESKLRMLEVFKALGLVLLPLSSIISVTQFGIVKKVIDTDKESANIIKLEIKDYDEKLKKLNEKINYNDLMFETTNEELFKIYEKYENDNFSR